MSNEHTIYLRKSRADIEAEARGEGETLARHERALLELARKRELNVTQIYHEVVSGETIAARPVMQQLLAEVELNRWAGVLVMEVERLARGDTSDQGYVAQAFKFSGTKIITPVKTYDPNNEFDEEYFEFGLFMSRREYKTINRRLQQGRLASVKEGKYVGNQSPYGYDRVPIEGDKGFTLRPDPQQADVVRMIYELYTRGELRDDGSYCRIGVSLIARRLNALGIPSKKKSRWSDSSIRDILINPVYIGKVRWKWRPAVKRMVDGRVQIMRPRAAREDCVVVDGLHEAIIDEDTFAAAQEFMSNNPPQPVPRRHVVKNALAGIVKCGACGRSMNRRPYTGNYPDTLMCPNPECSNVSSHLHLVEEKLISSLATWLDTYKLQWSPGTKAEPSAAIRAKHGAKQGIETELSELSRQRNATHDLLERGVYDTDTFLERIKVIGQRIAGLEAQLEMISEEIAAEEYREQSRGSILPKVEYLLDVYHSLPSAKAKNDLLKEVLEKAVYTKAVGGRWHASPDGFGLVVYPRLPRL